ncbi:MAG: hypothetical protein ACR2PX_03750 [Endozoicomonas sp.]|uniref:hypothetical protein n=1 Tax=Endozoicomonas sp. TaxID=1892382 RepID=UPI003D9B2076
MSLVTAIHCYMYAVYLALSQAGIASILREYIKRLMAVIREVNVTLLDWETRLILESLDRELTRLNAICKVSADEDEVADAGNDFLKAQGLRERLEKEAASVFREPITGFDK